MKTTHRGFTLIELLIVVVVVGILAAIAIPKFSATREKAFISTLKADLRNLASQQELYYNENYTFTTDHDATGFVSSEGVIVTPGDGDNTGWSASAAHPGLPGESCAIFHGDAAPLAPATVESRVACTM
jgi:prepilin-type N-terminal cleavage/methylation domain-containing protein